MYLLQKIKSYCAYTQNVSASIDLSVNPNTEITQTQARQIFLSFCEAFHKQDGLTFLHLNFKNNGLVVLAKSTGKNTSQVWKFVAESPLN